MVKYGFLSVSGILQKYDTEEERDKAVSGFREGDYQTFEEDCSSEECKCKECRTCFHCGNEIGIGKNECRCNDLWKKIHKTPSKCNE